MKTLPALFLWTGFVFLFSGLAHGAKNEDPDPDSQLVHETRLIYQLNKSFDIFTAGAFKLTDDINDATRASGRVGMTWHPVPEMAVTPSYLYTVRNPGASDARAENRLCLLLAYRLPVSTATLTFANTTEYRIRENFSATWQLRPRIKIGHAIGPAIWGFDGYVADELYFDARVDQWTQNRVFVGFEKKMGSGITTEVYYCRQIDTNGGRDNANIVGINFRILFGRKPGPAPYVPSLQ